MLYPGFLYSVFFPDYFIVTFMAFTNSLGMWLVLGFEERNEKILARKCRGYVLLAELKTKSEVNLTMNVKEVNLSVQEMN